MTPEEVRTVPPKILSSARREQFFDAGYLVLERIIDDFILINIFIIVVNGLVSTIAAPTQQIERRINREPSTESPTNRLSLGTQTTKTTPRSC